MPIIEKIPPQKTVWINIFFPLTNQTVYCYHKNLGIIDDFSPHIWTLSTSNPVCAWSMCIDQVFQRKNYENCHLIPRCIKCVKCSIMPKPNFVFKNDFSVIDDWTIIFYELSKPFPSISYYFHIPKIFLNFFPHTGKIGIDEKVICYHNISN